MSNFLNQHDWLKTLIMALVSFLLSTLGTALQSAATTGNFTVNWSLVGYGVLLTVTTYLSKQVGTTADGSKTFGIKTK